MLEVAIAALRGAMHLPAAEEAPQAGTPSAGGEVGS
jgi:hypothetical protein